MLPPRESAIASIVWPEPGHRQRACFLSNRPATQRTDLSLGLYGLSNGKLDEPWPKTLRLKSLLLDWLTGAAEEPALLLDGLREDILPDIGLDPDRPSDVPQEPRHSPIFINDPIYGTRCSSVVAIDRAGQGLFLELVALQIRMNCVFILIMELP